MRLHAILLALSRHLGSYMELGAAAAAEYRAAWIRRALLLLLAAVPLWGALIARAGSYTPKGRPGPGPPPTLVVADGREALEAFLASAECEAGNANAVAVIPKTLDREALQAVAATVTRLRQWYDLHEAKAVGVTDVPPGTSIAVLVQRG